FAEPYRDRMLLPIDDPPDLLFGLITHELTHIFQFDIIPQSLIRRSVPLWVNEGHAEYERANWTPYDLGQVRDAAVADMVPKMTISRKDGELGLVLVSTKDGSMFSTLTEGFDKDYGFTNMVFMNVDREAMPWMSWSPKGDRIAYFVRTEKERTLIVQNVV